MPAVPIMALVSSSLGFLTMKVDKSQAVVEGWRLSEKARAVRVDGRRARDTRWSLHLQAQDQARSPSG